MIRRTFSLIPFLLVLLVTPLPILAVEEDPAVRSPVEATLSVAKSASRLGFVRAADLRFTPASTVCEEPATPTDASRTHSRRELLTCPADVENEAIDMAAEECAAQGGFVLIVYYVGCVYLGNGWWSVTVEGECWSLV